LLGPIKSRPGEEEDFKVGVLASYLQPQFLLMLKKKWDSQDLWMQIQMTSDSRQAATHRSDDNEENNHFHYQNQVIY
jgi:hypothetical protein